MESVGSLFSLAVTIFKMPFTLYGFTFSLWNIFFWMLVASLVIWFLKEIF